MTENFNPARGKTSPASSGGSFKRVEGTMPESNLAVLTPVEERGEIDLDMVGSEAATDEIVAGIENSKQRYDLKFVDYDHRASTKLMDKLLRGDLEGADEYVNEAFSDSAYENALAEAKTACEERGVNFDDLDDDDQDRVRYAIEDKDDSNPIKDMLRNTPAQLLRAPVGMSMYEELGNRDRHDLGYYDNENWEKQENGRIEVILDMLSKVGVDRNDAGVRDAVAGLVTEGPSNWHEGVSLDVIWCGKVEDATPTPITYSDAPDAIGRTLMFNNARVVLLDCVNGSGMDAEIDGPITIQVTADTPARLDSSKGTENGGWGWDDTAGVVHSAYRPGSLETEFIQGAPNA